MFGDAASSDAPGVVMYTSSPALPKATLVTRIWNSPLVGAVTVSTSSCDVGADAVPKTTYV